MPGKNPSEAFYNFMRPLQQDISCITRDILVASQDGRHKLDAIHGLTTADGPILLNRDCLQLQVGLQYSIIKTGESGKNAYRCTTKAYDYALLDEECSPLYAWHWHPFGSSSFYEPHTHPYAAKGTPLPSRAHFPSGRVALETVIRFAIEQLSVEPLRDDWDKILILNQGRFELHRSWRDSTEAPRPAVS